MVIIYYWGRYQYDHNITMFHFKYFAFQSTLPLLAPPALGLLCLSLSTGLDLSLYSCLLYPGTGDLRIFSILAKFLADEYYLDIIWPPPSCPPLLILCMWGRADPAPRDEDRRDLPAFPLRSITTSSRSSVPSSAACCRVRMLETLQWIINAAPDDVTFQISLRMIAAGSAPWCDRLAVCLYQCESKDTSGPAGH